MVEFKVKNTEKPDKFLEFSLEQEEHGFILKATEIVRGQEGAEYIICYVSNCSGMMHLYTGLPGYIGLTVDGAGRIKVTNDD